MVSLWVFTMCVTAVLVGRASVPLLLLLLLQAPCKAAAMMSELLYAE